MAGKKHPKKALTLAICHRLENESEKINREWHCGPECPSHRTNCAHENLLESTVVFHSEAICGIILHTCIYFDKLNFSMVEETSNDSSIYKY